VQRKLHKQEITVTIEGLKEKYWRCRILGADSICSTMVEHNFLEGESWRTGEIVLNQITKPTKPREDSGTVNPYSTLFYKRIIQQSRANRIATSYKFFSGASPFPSPYFLTCSFPASLSASKTATSFESICLAT
jgi:hypothetical protein